MIIWRKVYETGHPEIDSEHKSLVAQLNDLESAMVKGRAREHVSGLLNFLEEYTVKHFANEERCFNCYNCLAGAENRRAHQNFICIFKQGKTKLLAEGTSSQLAIEIHGQLVDWVKDHILKVDSKLKPYVESKGVLSPSRV